MKTWQVVLLALLLVTMPLFSACNLFDNSEEKRKQEEKFYQLQMEAIQAAEEANRKAQEEYYEQLQKNLEDWVEEYMEWQDQQLEAQLQAMGIPTDNLSYVVIDGD
jgi:CHAD domain-containing protein